MGPEKCPEHEWSRELGVAGIELSAIGVNRMGAESWEWLEYSWVIGVIEWGRELGVAGIELLYSSHTHSLLHSIRS
jgi:hypothetical protein